MGGRVGAEETCGTPSLITSLTLPAIAPCSRPSLLVWQPCIQTRCPSYLHWHLITLLEKSDSATSCLGFTTTWGEQGVGLEAPLLCPGQAGLWHAQQGTEQHPDVQGEGCCGAHGRDLPALRSGSLVSPTPPSAYLEGVAAWWHIGDVNPLAVDVMAVGVPAPHTHPLLTKVGTGKASLKTCSKEGK